ncbi:UPF0280 family protein [bacterium]|nr:UPF0280 family protein [bacterium]
MKKDYRNWVADSELVKFEVQVEETDLQIQADKNLTEEAKTACVKYRKIIKKYGLQKPEFLTSLLPLPQDITVPLIIQDMLKAAQLTNTGPMAGVAGAVSEYVALDLLKNTPEIMIENGGDIFLKTNLKRKIGLYAGESVLTGKIALKIEPQDTPLAICTSSGTVGHSLSFGKADAAVVLAKSGALADCAATAIGNLVKKPTDIAMAIEWGQKIPGIKGILIIVKDQIGAWGKITLD